MLTPLPGYQEKGKVNTATSSFEEPCVEGAAISAIAGTAGWLLDSVGVECSPLSIGMDTGHVLLTDHARESGKVPDL